MSTKSVVHPNSAKVVPMAAKTSNISDLRKQYGRGPIPFVGTESAIYARHLVFDLAIDPKVASARERFEAFSHSVRDILAQRWVQTKTTYEQQNAKRIYYLSLEFLIGRSLSNNVSNLLLDPLVRQVVQETNIDWLELLEEEPDAGLGNGGLGRLAACFLDSMATLQLPATGYGLRYEHGIFRQTIQDGWQAERSDNWLSHPDPWEVVRPLEKIEAKFGCSFDLRGGTLRLVPNQPSTLIGVPYDRPLVGSG